MQRNRKHGAVKSAVHCAALDDGGPQIQLAGYVSCCNFRARCVMVLVRGVRTVNPECKGMYAVPQVVVMTGAVWHIELQALLQSLFGRRT
jgi:hypothetical protein